MQLIGNIVMSINGANNLALTSVLAETGSGILELTSTSNSKVIEAWCKTTIICGPFGDLGVMCPRK